MKHLPQGRRRILIWNNTSIKRIKTTSLPSYNLCGTLNFIFEILENQPRNRTMIKIGGDGDVDDICHQYLEMVTNISNLSPTHLVFRHQNRCNQIEIQNAAF